MSRGWVTSSKGFPMRGVSFILRKKRFERTRANYEKNTRVFSAHKGKLLHGQGTEPLCSMVYGKMPFSWNGCELIAVANVMEMLTGVQDLPRVVYEFELNNMHYVFPSGYWGTAPKKLYRYFDSHGIAYNSYRKAEDFEAAAENSSCGIVSFWNNKRSQARLWGLDFFSGGLHTVAYRRSGGKYYVCNLYSKDTSPGIYSDISQIYLEKRFIIGYTFKGV